MTWRIHSENILLLGWGAAILLQLSHPMVAEGAYQHSYFASSRQARLRRSHNTVNSLLTVTFGTPEQARKITQRVDAIHGRVRGQLSESTGPHSQAGMEYAARMPDLLKWVQCSFTYKMLEVYENQVAALSMEERDQYVKEVALTGPTMGIATSDLPTNYAELEAYMTMMLSSGKIVVGQRVQELAKYLLAPLLPVPLLGRLLNWYFLLLPTAKYLPAEIRMALGLRWNKFDQLVFTLGLWWYRHLIRPLLPRHWRLFPQALEAEQRTGIKITQPKRKGKSKLW
jgi:uncharacterized protein (DUF2236 family)